MISWTDEEIEEIRIERLQEFIDVIYPTVPSYSYHEAVDRSSIFCDLLEYLLNHPSVLSDPVAFKLAHDAHTNIFNLYQHMAFKHAEAPSAEEGIIK
jgi:hypothetical protein